MISIRPATAADAQLVFDFIVELAVYEKARHEVKTSVAELAETMFGPAAKVKALICSIDGQPVGYAVYFYTYSTWLGKNGIWLEDVYVSPAARGKGAGKALLKHVAQIAVKEGCGRFEWSVLDWNTPSIEFYKSLGAKHMEEWDIYRVTGEALHALAAS
jgi:GNAT superfamily N-acetyltransferase